jgi:hypothetical protein
VQVQRKRSAHLVSLLEPLAPRADKRDLYFALLLSESEVRLLATDAAMVAE